MANVLVVTVGLIAIVLGVLVVRNYETVYDFFSSRRREMIGDRLESRRFSRPETIRAVGVGWIALGVVLVVVGLLHPGLRMP